MKICSVGAKLFHADRQTEGQTDMTMLIVAFRSSANAYKGAVCQSTVQCSCNENQDYDSFSENFMHGYLLV